MSRSRICRITLLLAVGCLSALQSQAINVSMKLPPLEISDGEVQPGIWNSNVSAVIQKARKLYVPLLIVSGKRGCPHCARLMASMTNDTFVAWQKERNIFMAFHRRQKFTIAAGGDGKTNKASLLKEMSGSGVSAPVVCVYWLKEDGSELKYIFSGTRGNMLGQKCEKLECELMQAVDSVIGSYKGEFSQPQKPKQKEVSK